jgi:hypothetical protein
MLLNFTLSFKYFAQTSSRALREGNDLMSLNITNLQNSKVFNIPFISTGDPSSSK